MNERTKCPNCGFISLEKVTIILGDGIFTTASWQTDARTLERYFCTECECIQDESYKPEE